jgi:hypothetical protein
MRRAAGYHAYARETPVLDAIGSVIGVASVVIGAYALLFLGFAMHHGNDAVAMQNALLLAVIAVANGLYELLRYWRRHHG